MTAVLEEVFAPAVHGGPSGVHDGRVPRRSCRGCSWSGESAVLGLICSSASSALTSLKEGKKWPFQ